MWLVTSQRLLSLSDIRRPCRHPLTHVTGSQKRGNLGADHTQEKSSNKFSAICTPFSFLEAVCNIKERKPEARSLSAA